jgi:hypothetical protein
MGIVLKNLNLQKVLLSKFSFLNFNLFVLNLLRNLEYSKQRISRQQKVCLVVVSKSMDYQKEN